jgi:hypothetical protein
MDFFELLERCLDVIGFRQLCVHALNQAIVLNDLFAKRPFTGSVLLRVAEKLFLGLAEGYALWKNAKMTETTALLNVDQAAAELAATMESLKLANKALAAAQIEEIKHNA